MTGAPADRAATLVGLGTTRLSDAMDAVGLTGRGCPGIVPLFPDRAVCGPAFTVDFALRSQVAGKAAEYLDHVGPGDVIVLANHGRLDCSVWGGLRSAAAQARGAAGAVADGCYRDVAEHRELGFAVFGRGAVPHSSIPYVAPSSVGRRVTIAGVEVDPGDWVVGDDSGVVIVPASRADEVIAIAARLAAAEGQVLADLAAGRPFSEAQLALRRAKGG
jgi:regulator of RNase E activity RraA